MKTLRIALTSMLLLAGFQSVTAQFATTQQTNPEYRHFGEAARPWSMPATLDGSAGIGQYPSASINFLTQMATRFSPAAGDRVAAVNLYLDSILSGAADSTVQYAGPQAAFAWPFPFTHVPQTFIKQAIRFTAPESARLSAVDLFAAAGISSSDGFNDTLMVSFYRPFVPQTTTVKYGNENPNNNPTWEFNFPVGTARSAYGTRFSAPAGVRVNSVQFWVQNMNHNTFLPAGDPVPNDSLIVRLYAADENNLPGALLATRKVSIGQLTIRAWNEVSFLSAAYTTEMPQELIFTFELEPVGLQDHVALSSGASFDTPLNRSIVRENGNWVTIAASTAFSGGPARGAELWTRATFISAADIVDDPLTPDEARPIAEPVKILMRDITPNAYNTIDLGSRNIQLTKDQDVWIVAELIHVGQPDQMSFISDAALAQPINRTAVYVSDAAGGERWKFMQNTQFNNEFVFRMRATFAIEDETEVSDNIFLVMYSDATGLPGDFLHLLELPLANLTPGQFNRIDVSGWNYVSTGAGIHIALGADYKVNQFALSTDNGLPATGANRSSGFFQVDGWKPLADVADNEPNLLLGLEYIPATSIDRDDTDIRAFRLMGNYPNPFNPVTQIRFELAHAAEVDLAVYDLLGRRVATLSRGLMSAGTHSATFNGAALSSGTYLVRMSAAGQTFTAKMTLLK
jgi:hypothetical protein